MLFVAIQMPAVSYYLICINHFSNIFIFISTGDDTVLGYIK